jgi:hypothetical protein
MKLNLKKKSIFDEIKAYIKWKKSDKLFLLKLLDVYYDSINPEYSYIKSILIRKTFRVKNFRQIRKQMNELHLYPILEYEYLNHIGKTINVKITTIDKINRKYNIKIRRNKLPLLDELQSIYPLIGNPEVWGMKYHEKAKWYIDNTDGYYV